MEAIYIFYDDLISPYRSSFLQKFVGSRLILRVLNSRMSDGLLILKAAKNHSGFSFPLPRWVLYTVDSLVNKARNMIPSFQTLRYHFASG